MQCLETSETHATSIAKSGYINYESEAKLSDILDRFNMSNISTESGLLSIRDDRDYALALFHATGFLNRDARISRGSSTMTKNLK